jgi:RNA polymerase sigma-70 factor, ECF subfamily
MVNKIISVLYKQLGQKILKFILKRNGGDFEIAEQVLQDTFVTAYKSFHTFHKKSTYFTWLCKIALNKLADYYRHQIHTNSRLVVPTINEINSFIDPSLSFEERLILDELRLAVGRCLSLLPEEYRQLLRLKYYEDLSSQEICVQLKLSPRQLEGKLYRARHALAAQIAKTHPELTSAPSKD